MINSREDSIKHQLYTYTTLYLDHSVYEVDTLSTIGYIPVFLTMLYHIVFSSLFISD